MATAAIEVTPRRVARTSSRDPLLIALAALHPAILLACPAAVAIAIGLWWNANTISHNFIHRPFFRSRRATFLFSCYLSALLGFPQSWWRDRHLAHHADVPARVRWSARLAAEVALILSMWAALLLWNPRFFAVVYLPGYFAGLLLCAAQGHYEHARGVTSHYGRLYNWLFLNDGFHSEHHAHPGVHWSQLPSRLQPGARSSRWPAMLRWIDDVNLETLERMVLRSPLLRSMVVRVHRRAFRELLLDRPTPRRVTIVGGGLFPRTALLLRDLLPGAQLTILDASPRSIEAATALLPRDTGVICGRYTPGETLDCDLAVLPLSFTGDRERIYRDPPARVTLVHDWIWRTRGHSRVVSILLLKRVNLVTR